MGAKETARNGEILKQAGMDLDRNGVLIYARNSKTNIQSMLDVESNRISLVVEGSGPNAHVKAASIVAGINKQTGSFVKISADVVDLDGYVKADKLTTNYFNSMISSIGQVTMQNATVNGGLTCFGRVTGNVVSGMTMELGGASFSNVLVSATVSGNTLTLKNQKGQSTTFSKAVTVERGWSGGKYSVTPTAGTISPADVSTTLNNNGTAYRDGSILCIPVYSDLGYTGKELYVGLSTLSSATGGLSKYGTASLYIKLGDDYSPVGNHTWYYKNSNTNLTTYYYFSG